MAGRPNIAGFYLKIRDSHLRYSGIHSHDRSSSYLILILTRRVSSARQLVLIILITCHIQCQTELQKDLEALPNTWLTIQGGVC